VTAGVEGRIGVRSVHQDVRVDQNH
jgi:hypothetical protein